MLMASSEKNQAVWMDSLNHMKHLAFMCSLMDQLYGVNGVLVLVNCVYMESSVSVASYILFINWFDFGDRCFIGIVGFEAHFLALVLRLWSKTLSWPHLFSLAVGLLMKSMPRPWWYINFRVIFKQMLKCTQVDSQLLQLKWRFIDILAAIIAE